MRHLTRQIYKLFKWNQKIKLQHFTRSATTATALNERTLTGRFLLYMKEQHQKNVITKNLNDQVFELIKSSKFEQIKELNTNELILIFQHIKIYPILTNEELTKVTKVLDVECSKRSQSFTIKTTLEFLKLFMDLNPNKIIECAYYNIAIKKLYESVYILNKEEMIQFMFFSGLNKKRSIVILRKCLSMFDNNTEFIKNLTIEDICILCNSTFKASVKIKNKEILNKIIDIINNNLSLLKDPGLLITLIKTIRHNRSQTSDLLATISCTIFFNKTLNLYSFTALCHILALYSDYLYYDENLVKELTKRGLELLKNSKFNVKKNAYFEDKPRLKDINRFLWGLSNVNCKLNKNDLNEIIMPQVLKRIECDDFDNVTIVEIMLYLWMMNYRAYDLVPYAFNQWNLKHITELKSHAKERLNLLKTCIYYEDPDLAKKLKIHPQPNVYNDEFQLKKRQLLQKVFKNLQQISTKQEIDKFTMGCQIPGLNIIGITGYKKKLYSNVHIEVLDEYTTLKNVDGKVTGLMDLKLRIMEKFDEGLIVIDSEEVNGTTDEELQEILLDELQLVC